MTWHFYPLIALYLAIGVYVACKVHKLFRSILHDWSAKTWAGVAVIGLIWPFFIVVAVAIGYFMRGSEND